MFGWFSVLKFEPLSLEYILLANSSPPSNSIIFVIFLKPSHFVKKTFMALLTRGVGIHLKSDNGTSSRNSITSISPHSTLKMQSLHCSTYFANLCSCNSWDIFRNFSSNFLHKSSWFSFSSTNSHRKKLAICGRCTILSFLFKSRSIFDAMSYSLSNKMSFPKAILWKLLILYLN